MSEADPTAHNIFPKEFDLKPNDVVFNLGCGMSAKEEYVNIDQEMVEGADIIQDLNDESWKFKNGIADKIIAYDIIEHMNNVDGFMEECHRVLKPGGLMFVHVPYYNHHLAYTDPQHLHYFTPDTFNRYEGGQFAHMSHARFKIIKQTLVASSWFRWIHSQTLLRNVSYRIGNVVEAIELVMVKQ